MSLATSQLELAHPAIDHHLAQRCMAEDGEKKEEQKEEDAPEPEPYWATNVTFVGHAILQVMVLAVGLSCEAIQCYLDLGALFARQAAANNGDLAGYDARYDDNGSCLLYFIPSTVLSPQPMAAVAGPFWRITDVLALSFVFASALPVSSLLSAKMWNEWTHVCFCAFICSALTLHRGPFSEKQGPWYEAWIMVLVGASIVGTPTNVVGPQMYQAFRYGVGFAQVAYGALTLMIGMIWTSDVPTTCSSKADLTLAGLRGQIKRPLPEDPREKTEIVEAELRALRKALRETYIIRLPMGEVEKYWEDLEDALALIK